MKMMIIDKNAALPKFIPTLRIIARKILRENLFNFPNLITAVATTLCLLYNWTCLSTRRCLCQHCQDRTQLCLENPLPKNYSAYSVGTKPAELHGGAINSIFLNLVTSRFGSIGPQSLSTDVLQNINHTILHI